MSLQFTLSPMPKKIPCLLGAAALLAFASCRSIQAITELPTDSYVIDSRTYVTLGNFKADATNHKVKVTIEQADSVLKITPHNHTGQQFTVKLTDIKNLKVYRNTFDVDVLTVPFKIRPSVQGFPEQLNANFDAAIYLGKRKDIYQVKNVTSKGASKLQISGVGYGVGGFFGLGSVTMNPYVTNQAIDYEYDGFVLNGGAAGIYDAKRFNIGLAIGADFLVDKNRRQWIYQGKPWLGVLFGINLN